MSTKKLSDKQNVKIIKSQISAKCDICNEAFIKTEALRAALIDGSLTRFFFAFKKLSDLAYKFDDFVNVEEPNVLWYSSSAILSTLTYIERGVFTDNLFEVTKNINELEYMFDAALNSVKQSAIIKES